MVPRYEDDNCTIYNANCDGAPIPKSERIRLFIQCIQVTPKADTIVDPFMGTGDVLITAIRLRRKFVGIKINQPRCDKAINWIQERKMT